MLAFSLELKRSLNIMQTISREGLCVRTLNRDPLLPSHERTVSDSLSNKMDQLAQYPLRPRRGNRPVCWCPIRLGEKQTSGNRAVITAFLPPLAADTVLHTHPAPTHWLQKVASLLCHLLETDGYSPLLHLQVSCCGITGPLSGVHTRGCSAWAAGEHGGPASSPPLQPKPPL